jgi:hypothetical protein
MRCQIYHEATLNRWHTICAHGTRGLSTWNPVLERCETAITRPSTTLHRRGPVMA